MNINSPTLFIEINKLEYIFSVSDIDGNGDFQLIYKKLISIQGIHENKIIDFDLANKIIKENIYLLEQKINFTFKNTIIILNNFEVTFINLTGFKKLNGSQLLKENITYILNSLKSNIDNFELQKKIIHIFNLKYNLDKKRITNIPIGLFGDFYSHEMSFCLIKKNDFRNLNNLLNKCNLKISKILSKNFVEGVYLSEKHKGLDTFFTIEINENNSQIFYFENDALIFEQSFDFGSDLVINDISKITFLNKKIIKNFLLTSKLNNKTSNQDLLEKEFFIGENYRKIKKSLINEIASARIQELAEVILTKNINLFNYNKKNKTVFLKINDSSNLENFKDSYKFFFSKKNFFNHKFIEKIDTENIVSKASKLIQYGWKKEAVPVISTKKSLIVRLFEAIFG
jgi:cell division protein FtsA